MKEPDWLTESEALAINLRVVSRFGGLADGVRDENVFRAALARPLNKWLYEQPQPGFFDLAAAYAFGIARGHPFHDGNKRTAYVVAVTFLSVNGVACRPDQLEIVRTMTALAEGQFDERSMSDWLRTAAR